MVTGGTPVAGSDKIELPEWKSGLPTLVQGLSPNSTAFMLLEGFIKGNIQMQGEAVRHLQEGNLARLRNVTIELMEPDGKILGTIKNVNFLEKQNEKIEENTIHEPTISEIFGGLEIDQELIRENIADVYSLGKQKQGRPNPTKPSPASKVAKKKKAVPEKPKPAPKSWLVSSDKTTPEAGEMKRVLLKANPRINPETGVPQTTEVERDAIQRLLESRGRGQTTPAADSSSSSEEETSKKKRKGEGEEPSEEETNRRTAKDLVAKKKNWGWGKQGQEEVQEGGYCGFPGKRKKDSGEENTTEESSLQGRLWEETWRNEW